MALAPPFPAPGYRGGGNRQENAVLIADSDSGIGCAVAVLFGREGTDIAIVDLSEHEDARHGQTYEEHDGRLCPVIRGHAQRAAFQEHAASIGLPIRQALRADAEDEHLWLLLYGQSSGALQGLLHHQHRVGDGLNGSSHLLDYSTSRGTTHAFTKSLASGLPPRGYASMR